LLIQRLQEYEDISLRTAGIKMMKRHLWYLSPELAIQALFSQRLSIPEKRKLVLNLQTDRGQHLLTTLPTSVLELSISRSLFETARFNDSFLDVPVETWLNDTSFKTAETSVKNLLCINDYAERGVALIQTFDATVIKDTEQKQYLLQVCERHRNYLKQCNRDNLMNM